MRFIAVHITIATVLTVLTQVGGAAWLLSLFWRGWRRLLAFVVLYGLAVLGSAQAAPAFGRVPLPCIGSEGALRSASPIYCLMNRTYVRPELHDLLTAMAADLDVIYPGTRTLTLDGSFPFGRLPMLPHLSHRDGRAVDVAFYYRDAAGYRPGVTRSPVGYFAFEFPRKAESCPPATLTLRWDMRWIQGLWRDLSLDRERMLVAVAWLADEGQRRAIRRVFLEPHLAQRYGASADIFRFQGCRAARHDDHLHIEVSS